MDDDLPPLISDAELSDSDDGSSLPELEQSDGSGCDADPPEPAPEAPAVAPPQQTGQQQVRGNSSMGSSTPAAHQQRHGIHLHPHQQHGHHGFSRNQRRGPVSERQRRMEAGINRNSRLWQVLDTDDSLAHSLGASPFEDDHRGPAAQTGMPLVQIMPTASGEMMVTATLPTGFGPPSSHAGPRSNPLANILSSRIGRSNNNSSSSSQRSGPLFVQGQGAQHGPNSAFQGLAMPFVMGGQINIVGPTAAGAAAGAAGQPRGTNQPSLNALTQQLARSIERSMLVGGDNFAGRTAAAAAAPVSRSVPDASATTAAFFRALATSVGSSQASSDTGSPMSGPFRCGSGPRLRARRSRHQSAAAAAASRAERAAAFPGMPGMFTFSSTPPQAAPVARADAASTAEAPTAPPAATAEAPTVRPAAVGAAAAAAASSGMPALAAATAPTAAPADDEQDVQDEHQQHQQQQGFSWWPPWRILASGWRLMSWLILGHNTNNDSGGGAAAAAAAATAPSSFNIFQAAAPAGDSSAAGGASFCLGQASALGGSASSSHARHGAARSRTTRARNHNRGGDSSDEDYAVRYSEHDWHNDTQQRQEQAARWTFPPVSSAAAAAAAPGSGGLSEAFTAARQEQQRPQRRQEQDEPAAPLAELDSRPSPSGKRQRSEETDSPSRAWSVNDATPVARGVYAATLDVSGQAGASSSGGQASQAAAGASSSNTSSAVPAALGNMPAAMADRPGQLAVAMTTRPEAAISAAFALSAQAAQAQAAALAPTAASAPPPSQQGQAQEDSDSVSSGESLPDLLAHSDGAADQAASSDEQQHEATQPHPSAQASVGEATGNVPLAQHQGVISSSSTNQQGADAQQAQQGPLTAAGAAAVARLGNAAALAVGSPEAAAAAPGAEQDDSSSLPELLDSRNPDVMDDGEERNSDSMPSLGTGSESGSGDESDGASTGPPSLGAGSSNESLSEDDHSLTVSSEGDDVPPLLRGAESADADGDHPPALVSGSEDDDSGSDTDSSEGTGVGGHDPDMPGLTPGFLSDPTAHRYSQQQRQQQSSAAAGGWDPAGLQPGQHSSGLRSGFLANGVGVGRRDESGPQQQQQQQQQGSGDFYSMTDSYYNRARAGPAAQPAATAAAASGRTRVVDDDSDSGSEGSWETASDQDLEHAQTTTAAADTAAADASSGAAAAAGTAAGVAVGQVRPRELYEGSAEEEDEDEDEDGSWDDEDDSYNDSYDEDEDEEEDEDEDEEEEECGCPLCTSMRLISSPLGVSLFGAAHGHGHSSSGGSARHRGDAQPAPAFSRPRSNAFMVPNSSSSRTTGGLDSLCGDTGGSPSSRRPAGLPSLPPRGRRGSSAGLEAGRLPEGCVTQAQSKARVDGVAGLLADAAFTQQLLQGLGGVDPGHSSVQYALEVLRGKKYMPVNTAVQLMAPGGVHKVMSQGEMQQSEAQSAARQLIRQWS